MELRREGSEAMYYIDYTTAVSKFEEIRKRLPNHPAGDLYLATAQWLKHLNKSRHLQTGLYRSGSNFYAGVDKAKEDSEGDAVDANLDRAFRERMAQAKTFENQLKDPSTASALDLVNYQYAEAHARDKEYKRAADRFIATNQTQDGDENLATVSLLRAAQAYDLAGARQEAIAQYKAVLARPNVYDTRRQAEKGLNKPFIQTD
jgi:tetratricopeptide (TPR) repeat protein